MHRFPIVLFVTLLVTPLHADVLLLKSGPTQVGLLELYTSEGCSSCPSADRWLRSLVGHPGLFSEFVPMAFHVDYWDYIGWKDRFAQAEFSARQRQYARLGQVGTVYTPGFLYNGRKWRNFAGRDIANLSDGLETGELVVRIAGRDVELSFQACGDKSDRFVANLALLGFGLRTTIKAGENRGRELRHDFVVLAHTRLALSQDSNGNTAHMAVPTSKVVAERYALVAWVNTDEHLAPLQAVGGYLPNGS
jgi:hypothetical protein